MSVMIFENIAITGIAAAVPRKIVNNREYDHFLSKKEIEFVVKMTGIEQRRFSDPATCASDLCYYAADRLLDEMSIERSSVDLLIFVSQTPDYRTPPTSMIIQHRLKLPKNCAALDINLGCSGFIYGLATAYSYLNNTGLKRALLLNGETKSKAYSTRDKATSLLFGDGATATLIERNEGSEKTYLSLNSDGGRSDLIKMPGGGYRIPSSAETLKDREYEDGSIRNDEQGSMNGPEIFNFTISDVPRDLKKIIEIADVSFDDFDHIIFHQANKFITDHIAKKLKIDQSKVVYSIQKFGNTSSVSIPLTITSELREELRDSSKRILLCGFGVGLSWGSAITVLNKCHISEIVEV